MTHLQKIIRSKVAENGTWSIRVGTGSPCTQGTVKCLIRAGYACEMIGFSEDGCTVYKITKV